MELPAQLWLLKIADELDARFGDHSMIPLSRVKEIAREVIDRDAGPMADRDSIWMDVEPWIVTAFQGSLLNDEDTGD